MYVLLSVDRGCGGPFICRIKLQPYPTAKILQISPGHISSPKHITHSCLKTMTHPVSAHKPAKSRTQTGWDQSGKPSKTFPIASVVPSSVFPQLTPYYRAYHIGFCQKCGLAERAWSEAQAGLRSILSLLLTSCVTLGKLLNLAEPLSPHL